MKVIRKKADAEGAAPAPAAPAAKPAGIKVVSRAPPPPAVSQEQIDSKKVAKLLERLTLGEHDAHCDGNNDIDAVVGAAGFASLQASGLLTKLKAEAEDTSNADGREAALLGFRQLCSSVGRPCEPYVVPLLPMMLERLADKVAPVREAAAQAAHAVVSILCPHAVELVLPGESRQQHRGGVRGGREEQIQTTPAHRPVGRVGAGWEQFLSVVVSACCQAAARHSQLLCAWSRRQFDAALSWTSCTHLPGYNMCGNNWVCVHLVPLIVCCCSHVVSRHHCLRRLCVCACVSLCLSSVIFGGMEDSRKWQIKEGALRLLVTLAKTAPAQVSACLPAIVPLISERMVDAREQVRKGGRGETDWQTAAGTRAGWRHAGAVAAYCKQTGTSLQQQLCQAEQLCAGPAPRRCASSGLLSRHMCCWP